MTLLILTVCISWGCWSPWACSSMLMYQLARHKPNIITRCGDSLLSTNPIADCLFSDHFKVISDLTIKKPSLTIKQISYRKTKSIDIESFKNDLLYVSTVLIALMSWSTYTTQHCLTHLMHTLPLSPRASDHGHLFHGTVWRLTKREERDGKQKGNGGVPDMTLLY